jgi:hypothetical protein
VDTSTRIASLLLLFATIACAAALPAFAQTTEAPPRITLEPPFDHVRDIRLCARPFERRGSVQLRAGFGGSTGEFNAPANAILRIDRVRTTLRVPGLRASAVGASTEGNLVWYRMGIADGSGRFPADGGPTAVYADPGRLVKIEINRSGSSNTTATGDYVLNGCLVDRIPLRLEQPHIDPPRLPPKILLPGETVRR